MRKLNNLFNFGFTISDLRFQIYDFRFMIEEEFVGLG